MLTMLMMKTLGAMVEPLLANSVFSHSSLLCFNGREASAIGVDSDCCGSERIESAKAQRPVENFMVGELVSQTTGKSKQGNS